MTTYVIPSDSRTVGEGNPPQDVDELSDMEGLLGAVLAAMAGSPGNTTIPASNTANVTALQTMITGTYMGPGLVPSGDTTGNTDTANIQALLNLGGMAPVQVGTFYYNAPLSVPLNGGIICPLAAQSFGVPGADYGVGGLNLTGAILKGTNTFADANAATGTIYINSAAGVQGGSVRLQGISLDLSGLPNGNNLHGILIQNNVACITIRDVTVYGGDNQIGGDCLHCVASLYSPPDLLDMAFCHFNGGTGGVTMTGVADSYVFCCESTGNENYGWNITNCNNTRFLGCKGETSNAGPGWLFTAGTGFTGIVHLAMCTSQANFGDGFKFTGAGTGTYQMIACSADGDGVNGGSGGGAYSGVNANTFSGILLADGLNVRVSSVNTSPQYGVSMTNSNTFVIPAGNIAGQTRAYNNGGGNTIFQGPSGSGGYLITPVQYAPTTAVVLVSAVATTFTPLLPAATTVAAGSNGGEISAVATWASPSAGVLDVATAGAIGWPTAGTFTVATSTTTATCTYTGIGSGGSSVTGVAYVSGSATGTVSTGGAVTVISPSAINTGSFVAPPSGSVIVEVALVIAQTTAATVISFGLAAKGTITPIVGNLYNFAPANQSGNAPTVLQFYVTGLTAGTAYSYDLIAATDVTADPINVPAVANTSATFTTTKGSAVLTTVRAV